MPKFKVGDKVKYESSDTLFTITKIDLRSTLSHFGYYIQDPSGWTTWVLEPSLEIAQSELDRLIDEANRGEDALHELLKKFKDIVSFDNRPLSTYTVTVNARYAKIEKPKFEEFTTKEGWAVSVSGNEIKVGCRTFDAPSLRAGLHYLIFNNGTQSSYSQWSLQASKKGVINQTYDGAYTLNWEDAERILRQLEQLDGVK